jgi:hypothetical protein
MKRYFLVADADMPAVEIDVGHWHYIDLASHGPAGNKWNLACLFDNHVQAPSGWLPFPPLYDAKTTLDVSAVPQSALADIGINGDHTCLEAVVLLGEINPLMGL